MVSSASAQDESNPALWLATRAGKIEPSCPLGTTRRVPQEKFPRKLCNKSFIDQASVKMAGYWPRSFLASLWTPTPKPFIWKCIPPTPILSCKSNSFLLKGFERGLVLKLRRKVTWKWPVVFQKFWTWVFTKLFLKAVTTSGCVQ